METKITTILRSHSLFGAAVVLLVGMSPASAEEPSKSALFTELQELKSQEQLLHHRLKKLEEKLGVSTGSPTEPATSATQSTRSDERLDRAIAEARAKADNGLDQDSPVNDQARIAISRPRDFVRIQNPGTGPLSRLIDISFAPVVSAGGSSSDDEELETLQGGGHDPKKRGFSLQQAELSLGGAVDPYFSAEAHFNFDESEGVETEEVFFKTIALPWGVEVKGGKFLSEFGLLNPTHSHAWDWVDQPVINTRLFGGDGSRSSGFRVGKLLPTPWVSELMLSAQDATGENMPSFRGGEIAHAHEEAGEHEEIGEHEEVEVHDEHVEEDQDSEHEEHADLVFDGIGGRPVVVFDTDGLDDFVYLARLDNYFDLTEETGLKWGLSGMHGPNSTGEGGNTTIYGTDVLIKWAPVSNFKGYPFVKLQTELIGRHYDAEEAFAEDGDLLAPSDTLKDWGLYSQFLYGFSYGWATGLRIDYATGSGTSLGGTSSDPFRSDRLRLSPLLIYRPTEFSRIRLQYNYDDADHLSSDSEHSVWLGFDMLIGTHPAHKYGQS